MSNIIQRLINPYIKTEWIDQIEDPTLPDGHPDKILEEGTTFTAERANNIENGVHGAYERIILSERELQRIRVQLDLKERANSELVFYDTFDGENPRKMELDTAKSVAKTALAATATTIEVADASGFAAFTEVTVYDGNGFEDVTINAINGNTLTVTPLQNSYVKGAFVARSSVTVDTDTQKMQKGRWGTYTVSLTAIS